MIQIKRYANRKLYDTGLRRYVTLEEIGALVRRGEDVQVIDHETGRDLTSQTLMQVVFEQEKRIGELLPHAVLTRLLRTGEDTLDVLRTRLSAAFDPQGHVEEEIRRRVAGLVERGEASADEARRMLSALIPSAPGDPLADLRRQVDEMEAELERLKRARSTPPQD